MTSNKQLQDLLEQVARGELDTATAHRRADGRAACQSVTKIWGSHASITIAPSARDFPKSSSASARRRPKLPASRPRLSGAARRCSSPARALPRSTPFATSVPGATYHADAAIISLRQQDVTPGKGTIVVAAAGTSDLSVAEEAARTAELMGNDVIRLYDVGVAGLHRILGERARLAAARVVIVVAGMEGALPSVISGLISAPVIAVPTSVGYGASFGGIAALLGHAQQLLVGRVGRQYR